MVKATAAAVVGAVIALLESKECAAEFRAVALVRGSESANKGACTEQVGGTVSFSQVTELGDVTVEYDLTGISPGLHGFHSHQFGDDSVTTDLSSIGQHFVADCIPDPNDNSCADSAVHGLPPSPLRQNGDMGNLNADSNCRAKGTVVLGQSKLSLSHPLKSIIGRMLMIHEKEDDGSQPFGNAGSLYAFGIIAAANGSEQAIGPVEEASASPVHCRFRQEDGMSIFGRMSFEPSLENDDITVSMNLQGFGGSGDHKLQLSKLGDLSSANLGTSLDSLPFQLDKFASNVNGNVQSLQAVPGVTRAPSLVGMMGKALLIRETAAADSKIIGKAVCGMMNPTSPSVVTEGTGLASRTTMASLFLGFTVLFVFL